MHYSRCTVGLFGGGLLLLGGCMGQTQASIPHAIAPTSAPVHTLAAPATPAVPSAPTVQVYRADSDCAALIPESVSVPEATMEQAVGAAIAQFETADFPIAGYRVNQNPDAKSVTVDLRLPPDSTRPFASLSPCEQFALFGSIRQTVMQLEGESVEVVDFTTQGQRIDL